MNLVYEVSAKVEAAGLDGDRRYTLQGGLVMVPGNGEPLQMAFVVPEELWRSVEVGADLTFELVGG